MMNSTKRLQERGALWPRTAKPPTFSLRGRSRVPKSERRGGAAATKELPRQERSAADVTPSRLRCTEREWAVARRQAATAAT